ncbi:hypothetical protein PV11_00838 [Exophiala sideris]|uniref:Alpha/beta hydrolase fold-3 domain-containing protein n=1 Tax=Exophiala sideris TaxID=1016849 RepID=A0A0D1ZE78_9EURO|nr:hypothetical protein PV11_00838 [Exophiala sideris]
MAPEYPYPAPAEDAVDALRFALSAAGEAKLGGKLLFVAGESSGAYLAAWSVLKLRGEGVDVRARIAGLALSFGIYDLSYTPSVNQYCGRALVGTEDLKLLTDAAFPPSRYSTQQRREPDLWPLYADLKGLPTALFMVGTADAALDDSVFMASRWSLAGNGTQLKIIPEACHAFTLLPMGDAGAEGRAELQAFLKNLMK